MIRKNFIILILTILVYGCFNNENQTSYPNTQTLTHNGLSREYFVYVPASYDETTKAPLMFNFHGGNGDIASAIEYSDMRHIADTAGFILVYPQGLPENDTRGGVWSYKDANTNKEVDNIGFVKAMIDKLASEYKVDEERIYSTGYSNGGEFSFELACSLSDRIAAIGVVARSMYIETYNNCSPQHPTAVLTIHGTKDDYDGIIYAGITYYPSLNDVNNFWINYNYTDTTAVIVQVPDLNSSDGSTVEHYSWNNGDSGVSVEHYKVIGGGHDWPGSFGNQDIDASLEIWNFVSKYNINGLR
jgi:polyhydroxybutyrate depolymerase